MALRPSFPRVASVGSTGASAAPSGEPESRGAAESSPPLHPRSAIAQPKLTATPTRCARRWLRDIASSSHILNGLPGSALTLRQRMRARIFDANPGGRQLAAPGVLRNCEHDRLDVQHRGVHPVPSERRVDFRGRADVHRVRQARVRVEETQDRGGNDGSPAPPTNSQRTRRSVEARSPGQPAWRSSTVTSLLCRIPGQKRGPSSGNRAPPGIRCPSRAGSPSGVRAR